MKVYCTSKNSGPESMEIHMVYLGTSLEKATEAVDSFKRYQTDKTRFPTELLQSFSALPRDIRFRLIQYYQADGWWVSVVVFDLYDKLTGRDYLTRPMGEIEANPSFSPHARRVVLAVSDMSTEQLENLNVIGSK